MGSAGTRSTPPVELAPDLIADDAAGRRTGNRSQRSF
jgi:hypothetical protein